VVVTIEYVIGLKLRVRIECYVDVPHVVYWGHISSPSLPKLTPMLEIYHIANLQLTVWWLLQWNNVLSFRWS